MENILKKNIHDLSNKLGSEVEQSMMRLFVVLMTGAYIFLWALPNNINGTKTSILFVSVYTLLSLLLFVFIKLQPRPSNLRIVLGMILDIATISAYMAIGDHWLLNMSWIYLIIIIGNGFRFGSQFLNIALIFSLIGFTVACTVANYWSENSINILVVYLSILVLSFYIKMLLKRLTYAIEVANASAKAKSQFLANMSHEIRTPMNGVLGMLELALNDPLEKPLRKRLTIAKNSADALLVLLNDILDLSKIEAGKISFESIDFNIKALGKEVVNLLNQRASEKNIALSFTFNSSAGKHFKGDPTRIRQTIINLVGNAIKFTQKGSVKVDITIETQQQNICFRCSVSDTGIGISEESKQHIFDYFTQADTSTTRNFGGTGLGLALSQRLVHEMGGSMEVSSKLGEGSIFSFSLPLEKANTPKKAKHQKSSQRLKQANASAQVQNKSTKKINILVAEDNVVNQIVIEQMLTQLNCNTTIKNNGQLLLDEITKNQSHQYDLIFMDCQMPVLDGYEATKSLQSFWQSQTDKRIPIIALTANVMPEDKKKCLEAGMDDYLAKPIKTDALSKAIEKWLI